MNANLTPSNAAVNKSNEQILAAVNFDDICARCGARCGDHIDYTLLCPAKAVQS